MARELTITINVNGNAAQSLQTIASQVASVASAAKVQGTVAGSAGTDKAAQTQMVQGWQDTYNKVGAAAQTAAKAQTAAAVATSTAITSSATVSGAAASRQVGNYQAIMGAVKATATAVDSTASSYTTAGKVANSAISGITSGWKKVAADATNSGQATVTTLVGITGAWKEATSSTTNGLGTVRAGFTQVGQVTADLSVKSREASSGLAAIGSAASSAGQGGLKFSSAWTTAANSANSVGKATSSVAQNLTNFNAGLQSTSVALQGITKGASGSTGVFNGLTTTMTGAAGATSSFANATSKTTGPTVVQSTAISGMSKSIKNLQQSMDENRRSAYALVIAGAQVTQMANQINNALKNAVSTYAAWDFNLRRAAGASGIVDDQSKAFKDLGQSTIDLSIATKLFDPTTVAKGIYFWASTTGAAVDATNELLPVMKLAAMTETDLEQSIKGVVNILQQWGEPMTRAAEVTAELFTVTQKTALELPNLIEAFKMVGPVASGFGTSVEDLMKIFGVLGDVGVKGSMAGRAIAMMFSRLAKPTPMATAALDEYATKAGMIAKNGSFWDLVFPEGKFAGVQNFLNLLSQMTKNLNQEERNHLLAVITTQNEWRALAPLVTANGESIVRTGKGILDTTNVMTNAAKYYKDQWQLIADSVNATLGEMGNKIQAFNIRFGALIMDVVSPLIKMVGDVALSLTAWADANPAMAKMATTLIVITGIVGGIVGPLLTLIGGIILLAKVAVPEVLMLGGIIEKTADALELGSAAAEGFGSKLVALFYDIPHIAVVIAVIATLAGVFKSLMEDVGSKFGPLLSAVGGIFGRIAGAITIVIGAFFQLGEAIGHAIAPAVGVILDVITQVLNGISDVMDKIGKIIAEMAKSKELQDFAKTLADIVGFLAKAEATGLVMIFSAIADFAKRAEDSLRYIAGLIGLKLPGAGAVGSQQNGSYVQDNGDIYTGPTNAWGQPNVPQRPQGAAFGEATGPVVPEFKSNYAAAAAAYAYQLGEVIANGTVAHNVLERLDIQLAKDSAAWTDSRKSMGLQGQEYLNFVNRSAVTMLKIPDLKNTIDGWVAQLASANPAFANAGYEALKHYAASVIESGNENVTPAMKAIFTTAQNLLATNNATYMQIGAKLQAALAQGFAIANAGDWAAGERYIDEQISGIMNSIVGQINSADPAVSHAAIMSAAAIGKALSASGVVVAAGAQDMMTSYLDQLTNPATDDATKKSATYNALVFYSALMTYSKIFQNVGWSWMQNLIAGITPTLDQLTAPGSQLASMPSLNMLQGLTKGVNAGGIVPVPVVGGGGGGSAADATTPLQKALDIAKAGADLADALAKVKGKDIKKLVKEAMGPIADAMVLAESITAKSAKGISKESLQKVADFADAMGKIASFIGTAFDAFSKAKDFKTVSKKVLTDLMTAVDTSTVLLVSVSKKFKNDALAQAKVFADSATSIITLLGTAFDTFAKVPSDFTSPPATLLNQVAFSIRDAVNAMEKVVKTDETALLTSAKEFSDAAGSIMTTIGAGLDLFTKNFNFTPPTPAQLEGIVEEIRIAISAMLVKMQEFNKEFNPTYGAGGSMGILKEFSETAGSIMSAIAAAVTLFTPPVVKAHVTGETIGTNPFTILSDIIDKIGTTVTLMNAKVAELNIDSGTLAKVKLFTDTASAIISTMTAFFALKDVNATTNGASLVDQININLGLITANVNKFILEFTEQGADLVGNFAAGIMSNRSALANAIYAIETMVRDGLSGKATLTVTWNSAGGPTAGTPGVVGAAGTADLPSTASSASGSPQPNYGQGSWVDENGAIQTQFRTQTMEWVKGVWTDLANAIDTFVPPQYVGNNGPNYTTPASGTGSNTVSAAASPLAVNVNVTSSDNSVNSVDRNALGSAIADSIRSSLQHSAAIV